MSAFTPVILDDASVMISDDGTEAGLKDLGCAGNHIEISPDVGVTTLDTFCGSYDYPGTVKWSLVLTLYQSFDVDGPEEVLSAAVALPARKTLFRVIPFKSQPVSAQNPMWEGEVVPQPYAPLNGDAGDASEIDLEWSIIGTPTKSILPPTVLAAGGWDAMTVAELQAELESRGLATSGTKAELIERLTAEPVPA